METKEKDREEERKEEGKEKKRDQEWRKMREGVRGSKGIYLHDG